MTPTPTVQKDWQRTFEACGAVVCGLVIWLMLRWQTSVVVECENLDDSIFSMRYKFGTLLMGLIVLLSYTGVWGLLKHRQAKRAALTGQALRPSWWIVAMLGTVVAYANICFIYLHLANGCTSYDYAVMLVVVAPLSLGYLVAAFCIMLFCSAWGCLAEGLRRTM